MICVVVLQNCMCCVEGETGPCSMTRVTSDVDGSESVSIQDEEVVNINESREAITFPSIKTELEVRLWGVCEMVAGHSFGLFLAQQGMCEITLNYFLLL